VTDKSKEKTMSEFLSNDLVSGESFSSSPANKAHVGACSNNSQYAPNSFFLKLSNIEQQFIPGWPTIGWKPKKLLLAG
jgi:hypothetical protein